MAFSTVQARLDAIGSQLDAKTRDAFNAAVDTAVDAPAYTSIFSRDPNLSLRYVKYGMLTALVGLQLGAQADTDIAAKRQAETEAQGAYATARHVQTSAKGMLALLKANLMAAHAEWSAAVRRKSEVIELTGRIFTAAAETPQEKSFVALVLKALHMPERAIPRLSPLPEVNLVDAALRFEDMAALKKQIHAKDVHQQITPVGSAEVQKAIKIAADDTGLRYPDLLPRVVKTESSGNPQAYSVNPKTGAIIARGLTGMTPAALEDVAAHYGAEFREKLARWGDRFQPAIDWLDHKKNASEAKVLQLLFDPLFSAYAGSYYLIQQGANSDPAEAYIKYVSPVFAQILKNEPPNSQATAVELARRHGLDTHIVTNNPTIFGVAGRWNTRQIKGANGARFAGVTGKPKEAAPPDTLQPVVVAADESALKPKGPPKRPMGSRRHYPAYARR